MEASCHCGKVKVEAPRPRGLTECNCSICRRYGALWAYYTRPSVRIEAAPRALKGYSWGSKAILFQHCAACGCVVFYERERDRRIGVNARMFPPREIASVRIKQLDGAGRWEAWESETGFDLEHRWRRPG